MPKHRTVLTHQRQRSVLTDMLPFEVPPTFSNSGYYAFIKKHRIEIEGNRVQWLADSDHLDVTMRLLFGAEATTTVSASPAKEWGKQFTRRSVPLSKCELGTIPFNFRVTHKTDGRTLSVVHPRNQICVASFYTAYSALITYYCSLSEFSIRRPVSVSRFSYFKDKLHEERFEASLEGVEVEAREYEQLGSFFVYRKYQNIHRFFESYEYHRSEKKYSAMVQIDLNKCFDSIYTHTLPWATLGKPQAKQNLEKSKSTFGGKFDSLMQLLNHRETNGIVIGPEFSRVFAEIILQSVDLDVQQRLLKEAELEHRVDYAIFRYVDDYFVFFNDPKDRDKIIQTLQEALKSMKLGVNPSKIKSYEKPIITEVTIAKERVSSLLNSDFDIQLKDSDQDKGVAVRTLAGSINSNKLIVRYKTVIKESKVEYGELLNYTLAILENKVDGTLKIYSKATRDLQSTKKLIKILLGALEFAFFIYSASPKVNHTVRLCRLVTTCVTFLNSTRVSFELKHQVFKFIYDNVVQQLERNRVSIYREIESLYLLTSLSQIGREYWMPEASLVKYLGIRVDPVTGDYSRDKHLTHFSVTVLLNYIKNKVRYKKLREFIEAHAIEKISAVAADCPNDAEAFMLFLDLLVCPYVTAATKVQIGTAFNLGAVELGYLQSSHDHWFTAWGAKFDIGRELDAKRSREVY